MLISKISLLNIVVSLLFILAYKYHKKSHQKVNVKKEKYKKFNEDFGDELNDIEEINN